MSANHGYTHRAVVLAATAVDAHVEIPALAPGASWGPIPTAVPGLVPGESVLVTQIGLSQDTLAVVARAPGRWPDYSEIPGLSDVIDDVIADWQAGDAALDTRLDTAESTLTSNGARLTALEALRHHNVLVGGATTVHTTSATYVSLGSDDVSLTMPYPPSGIVTVVASCSIQCSQVGTGVYGIMGYEIRDTNSSGTIRFAANDDYAPFSGAAVASRSPGTVQTARSITGLPTSGTLYIRALYRSTVATTNDALFAYRGLVVMPSP